MMTRAWTAGSFALLMLGASVVTPVAQDRTPSERPASGTGVPNAPVGHRQPTAADVAKAKPEPIDAEREKRERALDKKLQICRGC